MHAWPRPVPRRRRRVPRARRLLPAALVLVLASTAGCVGPTSSADTTWPARAAVALDDFLETNDVADTVRSVLVVHGGEPVLERYTGAESTDSWDVGAVTTGVVSALIGIALAEGHLHGVNETLGEMLPSFAADLAPDVARITLHQVMTHTAGFREENTTGWDYRTSPDWVRRILADRAADGPGRGTFAYSHGGAHLLSAILAEATGRSVLDYARERLFEPLGIRTEPAFQPVLPSQAEVGEPLASYYDAAFAWPVDPQGVHDGAGGLKLRPADLAKIGQLYLDGGRWEGRQLVPEAWVQESVTVQVDARGNGTAYGYLWWVTTVDDDPAFYAFGGGGQLVEVVPGRDLVVVVAAEYDRRDPLRFARAIYAATTTDIVAMCVAPYAPASRPVRDG